MKIAITLLSLVLLGSSCVAPQKPNMAADKLEPYQCGTVQRIHTLGGVFLASQPATEDFKHAAEGGIKTVLNLRKDGELDWDEKVTVEKLGMSYHALPFKAPAELTDDVLDEARKFLNDTANRPLLVHCASANRVGAVWLAHRVLDAGLSFEEAELEAKQVGLKLPAYTERVKQYIATR